MNDASVAEQKEIFDAPLERAELDAVNALVSRHKTNAALTQQLALDSSRLVATSQDRLAKQAGAGFFKRLAGALNGKTSENQLLNQQDMLQMQKCAWHFLQQLQQQNLINAQSIAVIRNNLGTMNDYIIETRDFLEQAIDKIDHRLRHVENNTSFNNWALNIEANKRRFKSTPKTLLILRLTYDFMREHRHVALSGRDINHLVKVLENLDVNCDEEVELLDFISELIDQIEVVGIDQYRAMIELSFDEHVVDSDFIQRNISGIGFNALYFLSDQYEKIIDLISDDELCNSDEARGKIISKFFGNEFSGLSTTYGIRNLICEMIGGSQIAIDIYKQEHGLNVDSDEHVEEPQHEAITLLSSLPDIRAHTFLDGAASDESKRNYLRLFALCVENPASLSKLAVEFITLLTEKAGCPELQEEIIALADNPRRLNDFLPIMQALLDDDDKKYTWLFDAFFLLTLAGKPIENPRIKTILGTLKPAQLREGLPNMLVVINEGDETKVLDTAVKLSTYTQGWKNIIRYRDLSFKQYFEETSRQLTAVSLSVIALLFKLSEVYTKGMEHSVFISYSDGGFLSNLTDKAGFALCTQGRKSVISSLNDLRKKAKDLVSEHGSALYQANSMMSRWNIPAFDFKNAIPSSDFDLNNSADNEEWGDQFQHYYRQVDEALEEFSRTCDGAAEQLGLFVIGNFDQSVLKLKEQKRAELERDRYLLKQQEKLGKQSVTILKDGKEHAFSIEWQKVENPPCDLDNISHIKTDGKIWIIVASIDSDDVFYRSEDGVLWRQVQLDTLDIEIFFDKIDIVNGMWIIKNRALREGTRDEGFYYSSDALTWRHSCVPGASENSKLSLNEGRLSFGNIIYFNGMWLWDATRYQRYSYTEKGFFSDSTKTDTYAKIILFCAKTLDGPWQHWEQTPEFPEGVEAKAICALPGRDALLAFCEYNSPYIRQKKKPDTPPYVMYYGARKDWSKCAWDGGANYHGFILAKVGDRLMYLRSGEIFTSDKGYEWGRHETTLFVDEHFPLKGLNLFTSKNNSSIIYLTQDAKLFEEITLEEGVWRHIVANEDRILGVYRPNQHEETVLQVGHYICQPKV
jgi:hypothetical protein